MVVALGANLPGPYGPPEATLDAALTRLAALGLDITARSRWWRTAPVPVSDQPWFVNGVVAVNTALDPQAVLALLHQVEREFGRVRSARNEPRVVDLDLVCHGRMVISTDTMTVPHPRLTERAFVLLPLQDILPGWRHPVTGTPLSALIAALPADQTADPITPPGWSPSRSLAERECSD